MMHTYIVSHILNIKEVGIVCYHTWQRIQQIYSLKVLFLFCLSDAVVSVLLTFGTIYNTCHGQCCQETESWCRFGHNYGKNVFISVNSHCLKLLRGKKISIPPYMQGLLEVKRVHFCPSSLQWGAYR